jgi:outer membrane protein
MLGALLCAAPVFAQDGPGRIGVINIDRILREAAQAKEASAKLEQEFSRRKKDIDDATQALKNASDQFDREAPTLSDSQRQARQRQLMDQDRDVQRRSREYQEDLNARKQEELQRIIDRANKVVKQLAESEKYDVILQDAAYFNPRIDVTDKVIKALNSSAGK